MAFELKRPTSGTTIPFHPIFCAPGARGFFGEGYPWHKFWKPLGLTWEGTSFVAKTFTSANEPGNMPLKSDGLTPKEFKPKCIVTYPFSGHMLNAVGLSNVGFDGLWQKDRWQWLKEPFMLSFMPKAPSKETKLRQSEYVADVLLKKVREGKFFAPFALQINFACPNTGKDPREFLSEVNETLARFQKLRDADVPIVANFNATVPIETLLDAEVFCDAYWIANTIPWGTPGIRWEKFGVKDDDGNVVSPLIVRGFPAAGGLSGPDCLGFTVNKLAEAVASNVKIPIIAGNGIQRSEDVVLLADAGASAVAIGAVALLRPQRMKSIIAKAEEVFSQKRTSPFIFQNPTLSKESA